MENCDENSSCGGCYHIKRQVIMNTGGTCVSYHSWCTPWRSLLRGIPATGGAAHAVTGHRWLLVLALEAVLDVADALNRLDAIIKLVFSCNETKVETH